MMSKSKGPNFIEDYWRERPRAFAAICGEKSEMVQIVPKEGSYIVLASDDWRIFENGSWRPMTTEEQLEASL
jgi:hypothetical protein